MFLSRSGCISIVIFILFCALPLKAVEVGGNWIGTAKSTLFNCQDPVNNQQLNAQALFEFDPPTNLFPDNFEIDFVGNDAQGTTNLSGVGTIQDETHISGDLVGVRNGEGAFNYQFEGTFIDNNFLEFTGSGAGLGCSYQLEGILERNFTIGHINEIEGLAPELVDSIELLNDDVVFSRSAVTTTKAINNHLKSALAGHLDTTISDQGFSLSNALSAGDNVLNLGFWASYESSKFDNNFVNTLYKGTTSNTLFGVDLLIAQNMIIGVALGYEKTKIKTIFNKGQIISKGFSINPYFGFLFNDIWSVNLNAGYSKLQHDQFRRFSNTRIDSNTDGKRWFISANLNGTWIFKDFIFSTDIGGIKTGSKDNAHKNSLGVPILSNYSKMSALNIGFELAYQYRQFEPYFNINFNHNTHGVKQHLVAALQAPDDRNDILAGIGLRYYGNQGLSLTTAFTKRFKHTNLTEHHLLLMLRWDF